MALIDVRQEFGARVQKRGRVTLYEADEITEQPLARARYAFANPFEEIELPPAVVELPPVFTIWIFPVLVDVLEDARRQSAA